MTAIQRLELGDQGSGYGWRELEAGAECTRLTVGARAPELTTDIQAEPEGQRPRSQCQLCEPPASS